ncbi:hypothetical protein F2Q70_00011270 [Brassica cretica]|uniref:Uncharacterized protein n=1 Tax=Brassica cretica TaxID=69181 RepID=A0A8S9LTZ7_BRACR|nr:hypothetical protein F2Q70_00011270 [Brassica cretica]
MDREVRGGSMHVIRTRCQTSKNLSVYEARDVAVHAIDACELTCRERCVATHALQSCSLTYARPGWQEVSQSVRPGHASSHVEHERVFEVSFSTDFESASREGSVQLKVNKVKISSDGKQVNVGREREREREIKWSILKIDTPPRSQVMCCPELVQFYGVRSVELLKFDTPPESPKICPESREGSTRVDFSPYQYQGRLCPSQDKSSPFQSSRPLGFGQVLSDQASAFCLEHLQVPDIFKDSIIAGGQTIWDIADREDEHELTRAELECCVVLCYSVVEGYGILEYRIRLGVYLVSVGLTLACLCLKDCLSRVVDFESHAVAGRGHQLTE